MSRLLEIDTERQLALTQFSGAELVAKCFHLDCEREQVFQQISAQKKA